DVPPYTKTKGYCKLPQAILRRRIRINLTRQAGTLHIQFIKVDITSVVAVMVDIFCCWLEVEVTYTEHEVRLKSFSRPETLVVKPSGGYFKQEACLPCVGPYA